MKKDLILIGMPGSGKSSLGRRLAKKLGLPFLDLDKEIEKMAGKAIPQIFETDGEDAFRLLETKAFASSLGGGRVIATGGGIVTREENREIARQGVVLFIDRPLNQIMSEVKTETRPLLKDGKERLTVLYQERYDKYLAWADLRVVNDGSFIRTLYKIINEVKHYETHGN